MKAKMEQYKNEMNLSEEELFYVASSFTDFDHPCTKPDVGLPITDRMSFPYENQSSCFRYGSLLIAHRSSHTAIRNKLKKYGIECLIELPPSQYNFKSSHTTSLILHDVPFDALLTAISNPEFTFAIRTSVINLTEYLHLADRSQFNPLP